MEKCSKKLKKGGIFKEIRMIPELHAGPLQYRIGNLYDIVCLSQNLEGKVFKKLILIIIN